MEPHNSAALVQERREEILAICKMHGASNVALFGSAARGEANEKSDIDLLIDLDSSKSLLDHIALQQDLEDLLGRPVDVVTRKTVHSSMRHIMTESVPV